MCISLILCRERLCVDDSKSILAEIKGEDIDITSDSDNDEDELKIVNLAFVKSRGYMERKKACS